MLDDVGGAAAIPADAPRRLPRTALALAVALPLVAVALYVALGTPAALGPATSRGAEPTAAEIEKMVSSLAARLEENPDNPEGWIMLGRSYKVLGRFADAARAFDKAGPTMESTPELMLEVAEVSAQLNRGKVEGRGRELLQKVLQAQPDHPQALALAGTDAFFRQHYADAVRLWERVLAQLEPGTEDADNLRAGIDKARSLMAGGTAPTPAQKDASKAKPASVSGRVELAPALKARAAADDVVFIFARATEGPRMPLAVVRARVADLPMDFSLDDSMAMRPELRLSSAAELRVEARISRSGDAIARPGDLAGETAPIKPGARGLKLSIDRVVPAAQ